MGMTDQEVYEWNLKHGNGDVMNAEQTAAYNAAHQGPGSISSGTLWNANGQGQGYYQYNNDPNASQLAGGRGQAMQDYSQDQAARADNERWGYNQDVNASRGEQGQSLGMLRDAAMGNAPSRAELLSKHQMDQAASAQNSLAASARGPAALAMAQQQAAGNTARSMSDISANTSAMRADEMARARDAYFGGASTMRGQDQQRVDAAGQRQMGFMGTGLGYAGLEAQGRANDARLGLDTFQTNNNVRNAAYDQNQQRIEADRKERANVAGTAMQTGGAVMGMLSDVRAKENIQSVPAQSMEQYLATLQPASYEYNGAAAGAPSGQQIGPASAQAIASTQVGQNVVEQRPDGMLAINAPAAIKAGMSADAHINNKASRAEAKADAALASLTRAQAPQYADAQTAALMSLGRGAPPAATAPRTLASLTAAPTVVAAQPDTSWLAQQLASINSTNNVKGPR